MSASVESLPSVPYSLPSPQPTISGSPENACLPQNQSSTTTEVTSTGAYSDNYYSYSSYATEPSFESSSFLPSSQADMTSSYDQSSAQQQPWLTAPFDLNAANQQPALSSPLPFYNSLAPAAPISHDSPGTRSSSGSPLISIVSKKTRTYRRRANVTDEQEAQKKFFCMEPGCGARFKTGTHLRRHATVHSTAKPYMCEFDGCNSRFTRRDNLNQHYKICKYNPDNSGKSSHDSVHSSPLLSPKSGSGRKKRNSTSRRTMSFSAVQNMNRKLAQYAMETSHMMEPAMSSFQPHLFDAPGASGHMRTLSQASSFTTIPEFTGMNYMDPVGGVASSTPYMATPDTMYTPLMPTDYNSTQFATPATDFYSQASGAFGAGASGSYSVPASPQILDSGLPYTVAGPDLLAPMTNPSYDTTNTTPYMSHADVYGTATPAYGTSYENTSSETQSYSSQAYSQIPAQDWTYPTQL